MLRGSDYFFPRVEYLCRINSVKLRSIYLIIKNKLGVYSILFCFIFLHSVHFYFMFISCFLIARICNEVAHCSKGPGIYPTYCTLDL